MKNFNYVLVLFFLLSLQRTIAQTFTLYNDKTLGGSKPESYVEMGYAGNNELVIFGSSGTVADGDKTDTSCNNVSADNDEVWIVKFNDAFNIIWDKSLGGSTNDISPHLIMTGTDGKMIFISNSNSDSSCEKSDSSRGGDDYWICMLDSSGNKIWDKTYGGTNGDDYPRIIQLTTGEYIAVGSSPSPTGADKTIANYGGWDYWVVKMDSAGNKVWDNVYGGTGNEQSSSSNNSGFSLLADDSGSFIIAGRMNSPVGGSVSDPGQGNFDIWIIKIDSAGNKIWDQRYGGTSIWEACGRIIKTKDGGYIIVGSTGSQQGGDVSDTLIGGQFDVWLIKLDSAGNKQWDKRYGSKGADEGVSIAEAPGGGYWVSATIDWAGYDITDPPYGGQDYWMFKIDSAGKKLWDKRFGGPGDDRVSNFVIMPDSSIFLCGYADSGVSAMKTDTGKGAWDYWVVHFKYDDSATAINEAPKRENFISLFPSPSAGIVNIQSKISGNYSIHVWNTLGSLVYTDKINLHKTRTLDFTWLPDGMYFVNMQNERFACITKFIKE